MNIINYINTNKELKYIYFTFKSGAWLNKEIKKIKDGTSVEVIGSIFTPTAKGLGKNLKTATSVTGSPAYDYFKAITKFN